MHSRKSEAVTRPRDIHVVCPDALCDGDDWVNWYEEGTAPRCGKHRPRLVMVPCGACEKRKAKGKPLNHSASTAGSERESRNG